MLIKTGFGVIPPTRKDPLEVSYAGGIYAPVVNSQPYLPALVQLVARVALAGGKSHSPEPQALPLL